MKVHIFFHTRDGAWGGGNQFLKALQAHFTSLNVYEEDYTKADVILFNSHHYLEDILRTKRKYPKILFVHRIDGPIFYIRDKDLYIDKQIFYFNEKLADGTVYQSEYSQKACHELGMKKNDFETIIKNAPDPAIFNKKDRMEFSNNRKIRLISTSWSDNWKKGFDVYKWLDDNLDFNKYEMKFIGNTPVKFKNIEHIPPLDAIGIARELKQSDIFIFASKIESCSNALLEAIHCGLPAIAYNSTGNPELVKSCGLTFNKADEIPDLLNDIVENYKMYSDNINLPEIDQIGQFYYDFMKKVYNERTRIKKISLFTYYLFLVKNYKNKIVNFIKGKFL